MADDYRVYLGSEGGGVVLSWTVRARSELEAVQRSRRWFEERLDRTGEIRINVQHAESDAAGENPEVPGNFRIAVYPEQIDAQHARIRSGPE